MNKYVLNLAFVFLVFYLAVATNASGLSSASATLANPRLSFHALVGTPILAGGSVATIKVSGIGSDWDTRNLFPGDAIIIDGDTTQVASISSGFTSFTLKTPLSTNANADTNMTVSQTGSLTVAFTTGAAIPLGGSISISIPAPASNGNDGLPTAETSIDAGGFDTNSMTGSNITCPSGFGTATIITGTGGAPHIVTCDNMGAAMSAGANITFVIGDGVIGLVNPPPTQGRAVIQRGIAEIYTITAATYSGLAGAGSLVEDVRMKVAPDEGVLISATIGETLSFSIAGIASANIDSTCFGGSGAPAGYLINTTATSVPFGSSILSGAFYNAAQQLTVSTNAPGGYSIKVEENDQMGKEGKVCTGATAGELNDCIKDTTCNLGTCSETTSGEWTSFSPAPTPGSRGLGYSLRNVGTFTDAAFLSTESGRIFSAKQFPDQEASETKQIIMSNTGIVDGNSGCVIYRLAISGTQPAGYYYNKVKYTASATF